MPSPFSGISKQRKNDNNDRRALVSLGSLRIDDFPEDDDVSTLEVVYAHALPDVALFRASSWRRRRLQKSCFEVVFAATRRKVRFVRNISWI